MSIANEKTKKLNTKKMKRVTFDATFHNDDMPYILEILNKDMYKIELIHQKGEEYQEVIFTVNEYLTNIMISDFFYAGRKYQIDKTFTSLKTKIA